MNVIKFLRLLVALSLMPTIFGCQTTSDSITVEIPASETPKDAALSDSIRVAVVRETDQAARIAALSSAQMAS